MKLTWKNGRELANYETGVPIASYDYNENGIRTQKSVRGTKTTYILDENDLLVGEVKNGNTLIYLYDEYNTAYGFLYNGTPYYYLFNAQGDVVQVVNQAGASVATYAYDAWGKIIAQSGDMAAINPIRYRGYYYDAETELYYLQSRYYDATVTRFLNADDVNCLGLTGKLLSYNLFSYCENNPLNCIDPYGFYSVSRTWLALGLDIVLTLVAPLFSGPLDIIGRALSWYAKQKSISLVWDKLLYSAVPKFKGLFSSFFTAIRTAIWRVTGSTIANCTTTYIGTAITSLANRFKHSTWNQAIDFISCFFPAGSMIAGFLDIIDGNFDGRCRLW